MRVAATISAAACLILTLSGIYVVNLNAKNVQLAASLGNEASARQMADANAQHAEDQARQAQEALKRETAQRLATERQSRMATALRLASQSQQVLDVYPQQSLLLAVEALETTLRHGEPRPAAAEQALRDGLARVGGKPLIRRGGEVRLLSISPNGRWLAIGSLESKACLVDLTAKDPAAAPCCSAVTPSSSDRWRSVRTTAGWRPPAMTRRPGYGIWRRKTRPPIPSCSPDTPGQ